MKFGVALTALTLALAGSAQAQSAPNWSGGYVGLSLMQSTGSQDYVGTTTGTYDIKGEMTGLFGGFNAQSGALVYGGELSYSAGEIWEPDWGHVYNYDSILDLKGRVGAAFGPILYYATVGYSSGTWHENGYDDTATGSIAGLGVDYRLTPNYFIGIEWNSRLLKGNYSPAAGDTHEDTIDSLQLRGGLRF